jgi:DNA-binding winged helix-turn-helix (wHTH) protein
MLIISVITFLAFSLILFIIGCLFFRKQSKKFFKENNYLKNRIIHLNEKARIIDGIDFLNKETSNHKDLCNSIRIISNSECVIITEMDKMNGSFKPKAYSSSKELNLESFNSEFNQDNTLAIITGSTGNSKIYDKIKDSDLFPNWFNEIKFKYVIAIPMLNRIETHACVYVFFDGHQEFNLLEYKLESIGKLISFYNRIKLGNSETNKDNITFSNVFLNEPNKSEEASFFELDDNLELLKFKDKEISLSNSEYLIIKNLIQKNGQVLLYEEIEKILWPDNQNINKSAMRLHIFRVREKANDLTNNLDIIKTSRGKGVFLDINIL